LADFLAKSSSLNDLSSPDYRLGKAVSKALAAILGS